MSFPCSLNVNFSSMFTPRIVILSKDFTTWLSIWSNNLSTSSFIKSFGSMAIIWYLLGLACNRFTLYHCVTLSVSLFSSWTWTWTSVLICQKNDSFPLFLTGNAWLHSQSDKVLHPPHQPGITNFLQLQFMLIKYVVSRWSSGNRKRARVQERSSRLRVQITL